MRSKTLSPSRADGSLSGLEGRKEDLLAPKSNGYFFHRFAYEPFENPKEHENLAWLPERILMD
jgi:hypothetical protein